MRSYFIRTCLKLATLSRYPVAIGFLSQGIENPRRAMSVHAQAIQSRRFTATWVLTIDSNAYLSTLHAFGSPRETKLQLLNCTSNLADSPIGTLPAGWTVGN